VLGWSEAEVKGLHVDGMRHPDDGAHSLQARRRLAEGAPTVRFQNRFRHKDGSWHWFSWAMMTDQGLIYVAGRDVTAEKQAEEALRKAVVLRDDFLSVASHELRTPLTSLKLEVANLIRLLKRDDNPVDARVTTKVERIDAQSGRLHRLIDELLDVSRIAAGRLELKIEEVDLSQVAEEVRARFVDEATRQGCTLTVQTPPSATGLWDRGRVDQVLTNLISNAIKYGDGKPIEVTVDVDVNKAVIGVRDHGVGIPPSEHARIFGRFERAASSRNYGGIGLGLWIVRQIVEALGGQVTVESRPAAGSLFTVSLPRVTAVGEATAKRASTPAQSEQPA
jgi:signal transduction histidine kinase